MPSFLWKIVPLRISVYPNFSMWLGSCYAVGHNCFSSECSLWYSTLSWLLLNFIPFHTTIKYFTMFFIICSPIYNLPNTYSISAIFYISLYRIFFRNYVFFFLWLVGNYHYISPIWRFRKQASRAKCDLSKLWWDGPSLFPCTNRLLTFFWYMKVGIFGNFATFSYPWLLLFL